jgi:hypothetical protein
VTGSDEQGSKKGISPIEVRDRTPPNGMPRNVLFPESSQPVVRVNNEPGEVLHEKEQEEKSPDKDLLAKLPLSKEEKGKVEHQDQEGDQTDMISGKRSASYDLSQHSLLRSPARKTRCPAILAFYLNLQKGKEYRRSQRVKTKSYHPFLLSLPVSPEFTRGGKSSFSSASSGTWPYTQIACAISANARRELKRISSFQFSHH